MFLLVACVFENFIKVSINEVAVNPLFYVSLAGCIWQCGLKYTGINLQTFPDKDLILTIENNIPGSIRYKIEDRHVNSDENKRDNNYRCYYFIRTFNVSVLPYDESEM